MHTVEPPTDTAPDADRTLWMSQADGCPECVHNVEPPRDVARNDAGGYFAGYLCSDCGHAWITSWGAA